MFGLNLVDVYFLELPSSLVLCRWVELIHNFSHLASNLSNVCMVVTVVFNIWFRCSALQSVLYLQWWFGNLPHRTRIMMHMQLGPLWHLEHGKEWNNSVAICPQGPRGETSYGSGDKLYICPSSTIKPGKSSLSVML